MHFYETDAMGIIHHANYVKIVEEARVQWIRQFSDPNDKELLGDINYPVLHCEIQYKNPLYFNDEVTIDVAAHARGARLTFEYVLSTKRFDKPVAFGKTVHAAFDMKARKPTKIPQVVLDFLAEKDKSWIEI